MKILNLFVLKKSEKLNLFNEDLNINQLHGLLKEEVRAALIESEKMRVYKSLGSSEYKKCRNDFAAELLDIIQICIAGLVMLLKEGLDIELLFNKHNFKLIQERKWQPEAKITIEVEDLDV